MKLELKHLAPYLPYGLKYQLKGNFPIKEGVENIIEDIREVSPFDFTIKKVLEWETCKPILRPLSDLTKEIEVNGKHFTPCYHWDHSNTEQDTYCDRIVNVASDPSSVEYLDYFIVEKLVEWHFDIFGLIDAGLAVDINTVKF